jgi:iron(III) transport system permease protein
LTVSFALYRWVITGLAALAALAPLPILVYQSLLNGPLTRAVGEPNASAYHAVFADAQFWSAFSNTALVAGGMTAIAVPLGAGLAFLVVRTDLPGRRWFGPLILVPIAVSALVLAFGYVLVLGPAGLLPAALKEPIGAVPWNLHSFAALIVLAGLIHVPYVYVFVAAALRVLGGGVEDAARVIGAGPWQVAMHVSLPLVLPAIFAAGILVFLLGVGLFGLPLVLGEQQNLTVLSTYFYRLGTQPGGPPHQFMAAVAVVILAVTAPLILLQRFLLRRARGFGSARSQDFPAAPLKLRAWRWPAFAVVLLWWVIAALLPLAGIGLRSVMATAGDGTPWSSELTLDHYRALVEHPDIVRAMIHTLAIGVVGGGAAILCYVVVALAVHRWPSRWGRCVDYLATLPRAMPGIVAGLATLWLYLFLKPLTPLKETLAPAWIAYTMVWLALGLWLVRGALARVAPELEDAARVIGASAARVRRDVTLPLVRGGLFMSWLVILVVFVREYATGIYLVGPGTELAGPLLLSMWDASKVDLVAALAAVNVALIFLGLTGAVRVGARLHG